MNVEMWGLRPRNSFSGIICFDFSVLCLCSAEDFLPSVSRFPFSVL
jgi:hypothetical protein